MSELSDKEKQLLAREVAADRYVGSGGYYNDSMREVFISGWNAAIEYAVKVAVGGTEHLDEKES